MKAYICITCGVQYTPSENPQESCPICEDERQWVNYTGQQWTHIGALKKGHSNQFQELEPNLIEIKTEPTFAIGQRALLVQSQHGNILWDCISFIDAPTVQYIQSLGGIQAIAISHPHFYAAMVDWSHAFGNVPIYVHNEDRAHVMRPDPNIVFWEGKNQELLEGFTLIHCGGHFAGSSVLHWADGAQGQGALLTGDTIFVTRDTRHVSFMYSYPNLIPLRSHEVLHIVQAIEPFPYDRIYNGWLCCKTGAREAVKNSTVRYLLHSG